MFKMFKMIEKPKNTKNTNIIPIFIPTPTIPISIPIGIDLSPK